MPNSVNDSTSPPARSSYLPNVLFAVVFVLLVLAPVSTKSAGLFFLIFLGLALWVGLRWPVTGSVLLPLRAWLFLAGTALVLRGAATVLWSDSWGSRHFEGRVFLAALAIWFLLPRCQLSPGQKAWMTHAFGLACWIALAVVWVQGRDIPTNALPWAAGVGFMVCVLLGRLVGATAHGAERLFWLLGALAGLAAVLMSQSRGSFGLVLWMACVLVPVFWSWGRFTGKRFVGSSLILVLLAVYLVPRVAPNVVQAPAERIEVAVHEARKVLGAIEKQNVSAQVLDTSVGARLYMWARVVEPLSAHVFLGVGAKQREAWIRQLGRESGSQVIASLNHLHSDPLTIWFEHGLLGLVSYLIPAVGLIVLALQVWGRHRDLAVTLSGLAFMHVSAGLTNFNTIHNFYGTVLSLCILISFWMAVPGSRQEAGDSGSSRP